MRKWTWIPTLALAIAAAALVAPALAHVELPATPTPEPAVAPAGEDGCAGQAGQELAAILEDAEAPMCAAEAAAPVPAPEPEPIFQQGPPQRRGFCHCGCGVPCTTDSDCGAGGRCRAFVTCC